MNINTYNINNWNIKDYPIISNVNVNEKILKTWKSPEEVLEESLELFALFNVNVEKKHDN